MKKLIVLASLLFSQPVMYSSSKTAVAESPQDLRNMVYEMAEWAIECGSRREDSDMFGPLNFYRLKDSQRDMPYFIFGDMVVFLEMSLNRIRHKGIS